VGISVALQTIEGKKLHHIWEATGVLDRLLPIGDPNYLMLRYIDPYGNTIFNGEQMYPVMEELDRLAEQASTEAEREILSRIGELAVKCRDQPHHCLRFIGD
jgi:hypothetical protein